MSRALIRRFPAGPALSPGPAISICDAIDAVTISDAGFFQ
jgi:hypothetical protein